MMNLLNELKADLIFISKDYEDNCEVLRNDRQNLEDFMAKSKKRLDFGKIESFAREVLHFDILTKFDEFISLPCEEEKPFADKVDEIVAECEYLKDLKENIDKIVDFFDDFYSYTDAVRLSMQYVENSHDEKAFLENRIYDLENK